MNSPDTPYQTLAFRKPRGDLVGGNVLYSFADESYHERVSSYITYKNKIGKGKDQDAIARGLMESIESCETMEATQNQFISTSDSIKRNRHLKACIPDSVKQALITPVENLHSHPKSVAEKITKIQEIHRIYFTGDPSAIDLLRRRCLYKLPNLFLGFKGDLFDYQYIKACLLLVRKGWKMKLPQDPKTHQAYLEGSRNFIEFDKFNNRIRRLKHMAKQTADPEMKKRILEKIDAVIAELSHFKWHKCNADGSKHMSAEDIDAVRQSVLQVQKQ